MPSVQSTTAHTHKTAILAIILVSYVMIVLDISVVLTGLPKIHHELGFTDAGLAWVQSAYTLTFGGFLLLGARAGDILGRRRMFVVGMTIFTVASVAIGASQSSAWMLSWRAVQGLGSAILAPTTLALLQTTFDEGEERVRAVSLYSAAAGVSATVGLVVGGLLADWLSWRVGFLINLPIGIAMVIAARVCIHETHKRPGAFDLPGAVASTLGMGAFVYGFIRSAQAGWDPLTVATLFAALLLLGAFVLIERQARQPILPLRLFADIERSGAYGARVLYISAMVGFFFFTTLYLQQVAGLRPALAGLAFVPATMLHVPVAIVVPRLIRRFGRNTILIVGMLTGIVAMGWLSQTGVGSNYWTAVALPMVLIGISQGLTLSPLTSSGVARVDHADAGAASGAVNVAHQIGSSVGLGVLIAIAAIGSSDLTGADLTAYRVSHAFEAGTVMLVATLVISILTIVPAARRQAQSQEAAPTESAA
ncbi:MFS transporter [Rhizobium laguerreae]|uniref:MFS transporter n=1 Tax=Rhizobium laguerreae TaxID=1076926 RepID=UPI001C915CB5|nr:MFS transporter [Rhizobium laguerreae]MBY3144061.1 MFS transporter [Rhizobium laguerreae]